MSKQVSPLFSGIDLPQVPETDQVHRRKKVMALQPFSKKQGTSAILGTG